MPKRLIDMNWNDIQELMDKAGEPDKARKFGEEVYGLSATSMDINNIPSIENQILALKRVIAELELWKNILYKRQQIT